MNIISCLDHLPANRWTAKALGLPNQEYMFTQLSLTIFKLVARSPLLSPIRIGFGDDDGRRAELTAARGREERRGEERRGEKA